MPNINNSLIQAVEDFRQQPAEDKTSERLEWSVIRPCWSQLLRIAHFMTHQGVLGSLIQDDDLMMSFVMEATWELLCSDISSVSLSPDIPSSGFVPIMRRRVAQMVQAYASAHPVSGLAGTSAIAKRRQAMSAHSRRLARTLGYTPELDDAMDSYNDYLRATRKDPHKQGALVTHANTMMPTVVLSSGMGSPDLEDDSSFQNAIHDNDDADIADIDLSLISADIQRRADDHSSLVGQVAFELLDLAASGDTLPQAGVIAARLGADREDVKDAMTEVQQITIEVLDQTVSRRKRLQGQAPTTESPGPHQPTCSQRP